MQVRAHSPTQPVLPNGSGVVLDQRTRHSQFGVSSQFASSAGSDCAANHLSGEAARGSLFPVVKYPTVREAFDSYAPADLAGREVRGRDLGPLLAGLESHALLGTAGVCT